MAAKSIEDIATELATGYPTQELEKIQQEFTRVLEIVLPTVAEKARTACQQGKESVEEIWKAIRGGAEEDFQPALAHAERLKVLYIASKFMNNKAVGTLITEMALEFVRKDQNTV